MVRYRLSVANQDGENNDWHLVSNHEFDSSMPDRDNQFDYYLSIEPIRRPSVLRRWGPTVVTTIIAILLALYHVPPGPPPRTHADETMAGVTTTWTTYLFHHGALWGRASKALFYDTPVYLGHWWWQSLLADVQVRYEKWHQPALCRWTSAAAVAATSTMANAFNSTNIVIGQPWAMQALQQYQNAWQTQNAPLRHQQQQQQSLPLLAAVGRPHVGKQTLARHWAKWWLAHCTDAQRQASIIELDGRTLLPDDDDTIDNADTVLRRVYYQLQKRLPRMDAHAAMVFLLVSNADLLPPIVLSWLVEQLQGSTTDNVDKNDKSTRPTLVFPAHTVAYLTMSSPASGMLAAIDTAWTDAVSTSGGTHNASDVTRAANVHGSPVLPNTLIQALQDQLPIPNKNVQVLPFVPLGPTDLRAILKQQIQTAWQALFAESSAPRLGVSAALLDRGVDTAHVEYWVRKHKRTQHVLLTFAAHGARDPARWAHQLVRRWHDTATCRHVAAVPGGDDDDYYVWLDLASTHSNKAERVHVQHCHATSLSHGDDRDCQSLCMLAWPS